jgi:hypothetical protein
MSIEEPGFTRTLLISSCLALLSTFINGYNTGVMNAAEVCIEEECVDVM